MAKKVMQHHNLVSGRFATERFAESHKWTTIAVQTEAVAFVREVSTGEPIGSPFLFAVHKEKQ